MGDESGLDRIYQGEYTVYQRDAMYCFMKGSAEPEFLSLAQSFSMGGQYMFCPAAFEEREALEDFIQNGIAYLKRWNRRLLFMWITNPEDGYYNWSIYKLEDNHGKQALVFDSYRLQLEPWDVLSAEAEDFIFSYEGTGGYTFCSMDICLAGGALGLRLKTTGELCGTIVGSLSVQKEQIGTVMEKLDAGISYCRIMEEDEPDAGEQGFVSHAVNHVLVSEAKFATTFLITPNQLYDMKKTRFGLSGNIFSTHFAVDTGEAVSVEAAADAALVFQQRPVFVYQDRQKQLRTRKRLYLGIEGGFRVLKGDVQLLCGLSGTETILLKSSGNLRFQSSMPAVCPYEDASLGTTSWVGHTADGVYYCQPQKAALYAASSAQGLRYMEIPAASFEHEVPVVPMLPFRGLMVKETEDISALEESLYQKRREVLLGKNKNRGSAAMSVSGVTRAVTPQGLVAEVTREGRYNWIGFANLSDSASSGKDVPEMRLTEIDEEIRNCFLQKELLYVIETEEEMNRVKPSEGFCFSIEGVRFSLLPEKWRNTAAGRTMIVFQYSAAKSMADALPDNRILQQAIENAYTNEGEVRDGYEELVNVVRDAGFQGILAFNVSVSLEELPEEIGVLMNGIDTERFYASYLIIRAGGINHDIRNGLVLKQSKVSGLVDYVTDRKLAYDNAPPDYDYLTTEIRIRIRDSKLVSFTSSSEVLVNRLFEAEAVAGDNPDGNCLILQGRLVEKDNIKTYQYHLKQCVAYELSGSGIFHVWIQKMELVVGNQGEGRFMLSGVLDCHKIEGADLLGYGGTETKQGLPFSQLLLKMEKGAALEAPLLFSMEYGQLSFDREAAVLREGSFQKNFAVYLESMLVEKTGESLEQKGYSPITAPVRQGVLGAAYQGFVWSIAVGSMGGLSGQGSIVLRLVVAFWRGEDGNAEYYVGIRLPEILSGDKLKLQGIFKLGFGAMSLEQKEEDYLLKLHNFHVEILGASFPRNSGDIFLFSDGKHIGWYAAYEEG
ncbi:MAG: hypothetical protein K2J99_10205 [Lachnospiraceae bacterium]|nr:hypothetical protein [Lachnospiraceae bacterium]